MKNIIALLLLTLTLFSPLLAREVGKQEFDDCDCEMQRILDTYKRYEHQYIDSAYARLFYFINQDSTLKNRFLIGDSSEIKSLYLELVPSLSLDHEAINYKGGDNICKYIQFDTVGFMCQAAFFLKDTIMFLIQPISITGCDNLAVIGARKRFRPEEEAIGYTFAQSISRNYQKVSYYFDPPIIKPDTDFIDNYMFSVRGVLGIKINKKDLHIRVFNDTGDTSIHSPNEYIKNKYTEDWIRYVARECPCGGKKWWRFWDWDLFLKKPLPYKNVE